MLADDELDQIVLHEYSHLRRRDDWARLAQAIYRTLDTVPDGAHVLSLPDFLVEVPGLALSGLHVMIMEASGGIRNAILRFKEFVGSVNRAFSVDIGFDSVGAAHAEKLAVSVLADICMPILNLCQSLDQHALATGERSPAKGG